MVSRFTIKGGFALLELAIVMVIVGALMVTIMSNGINFMNRAKFQATVREMGSIAQAAIDYYNSTNNPNDPSNPQALAWPSTDASTLGSPFMPQAVKLNPFGNAYSLSFGNNMVTVTTKVPSGVITDPIEGSFLKMVSGPTGITVSISQSIPNEYSGRLSYDLQYIDKK
jgi:type II secretory pathway pseudopilin PulG